ncbi:MAG TPA: hypothetical protein VGT60_09115 [Candidatus Limnocylindria bacterium]|nr:hypothetical protein [Candidatus Limnocylindria bacterium]
MTDERSHFSFRVDAGTRQRLREEARVRRVSESELARRYVTEGVRLDRHPRITFMEHPSGRRAALRSRPRLDVRIVVDMWSDSGRDEATVAAAHELDLADVRAALDYYREHRDEIDEEGRRARQDADRLEAAWRADRG